MYVVCVCAVYEVFERMAYYGISSNLIIYLTTKLRQGTVTSSNNVTNWVGTIWMTPILGAYFADAVLGRYWTFLISAGIYLSVTYFASLFLHFSNHYRHSTTRYLKTVKSKVDLYTVLVTILFYFLQKEYLIFKKF